MDGEMVALVRLITDGGSFVVLCFIVLWVILKGAPQHFKNQKEIQVVLRATLADQLVEHATERGYLRETQERQHKENVEALARLARAIAHTKQHRPDTRSDPDSRPRES